MVEAITHAAFYTGCPKAFSAMAVAKQVFRSARPIQRHGTQQTEE
jgi:4-carboxymuconolactone decarboxylase